jgi:hypothetical protein
VNHRERLHTPSDADYHENQVEGEEVDDVYQNDELPSSFNIDPNSTLESLLNDVNDVIVPEERGQQISKKKKCKIFTILVFDITFFIFQIIIFISYDILDI